MNFKVLGSIIIVGVFLFFAYGSDDTKTDQVSNNTVDCSNYKGQYSSGYSSGSMCSALGDYSSCESFVEKNNYETGRDILEASDCYCEGFNDGKNGKTKKYSSDSDESNSNSERNYTSNEENTSESSNSTYENYSESNEYQQEESQNTSDLSVDNEIDEDNYSSTNNEEYNFNGFAFVKTQIKINPNPINGSQNVFFNKNFTLFDQSRNNEPIFPVLKNGKIVYQIYYSSNEDPRPYYGEFTPEQLEKHLYYKFKNKANCLLFCNSK